MLTAFCVRSTWAWHTWIRLSGRLLSDSYEKCNKIVLTKERSFINRIQLTLGTTLLEWIAYVIGWTTADGIVVNHMALCMNSTGSRTWILALLIYASLLKAALGANNTLRPTIWWSAKVVGLARTGSPTINYSTHTVGSAW